jgi:hypothetical protein
MHTLTDAERVAARKQIESLVWNGDADVLVNYITAQQARELAEDWNETQAYISREHK